MFLKRVLHLTLSLENIIFLKTEFKQRLSLFFSAKQAESGHLVWETSIFPCSLFLKWVLQLTQSLQNIIFLKAQFEQRLSLYFSAKQAESGHLVWETSIFPWSLFELTKIDHKISFVFACKSKVFFDTEYILHFLLH